jgi:hypothetical protein
MKLFSFCKGLILVTLVLTSLCFAETSLATAQAEALIVTIDRPGEGEHIYAGPNTLLYSIPIAGWIYSADYSYSEINLTLEIYQGDEILTKTSLRLDSDYLFSIHATVNPESTFDLFSPQHGVFCETCHHGGSIDLVPGRLKIRVIAKDPTGREAVAERNIVVDLSSYTTVPVQLEMVGDSQHSYHGIPITASTRLYMWRTRHSTGLADVNGYASIKVEALSEAKTYYTFKVEPMEVNGLIYESVEPVEVILSPGVPQIEPITLQVMARSGEIYGQLIFEGDMPEKVWAIDQSSGAMYEAVVSANGNFQFQDIPLRSYILTLDCEALKSRNQTCPQEIIHLGNSEPRETTLTTESEGYMPVQLDFLSGDDHPLPFVWVKVEELNLAVTARPNSGKASFFLPLKTETITLSYFSPGSKQQKQEIALTDIDFTNEIRLESQPDSKRVVWGEGFVIIPPETQAVVEEGHIRFTSGWLWGTGGESLPLIIETSEGQIRLDGGTFALEKIQNLSSWLFLKEGQAQVALQDGRTWSVHSGEMLSLGEGNFHGAVPMQDLAMDAIRSNDIPSNLLEFNLSEPSSTDRFTPAQVVQMVTLILIIGLILLLFYPWLRRVQSWVRSTLGGGRSKDLGSHDDEQPSD